jgi:hypothetical protein
MYALLMVVLNVHYLQVNLLGNITVNNAFNQIYCYLNLKVTQQISASCTFSTVIGLQYITITETWPVFKVIIFQVL